MAIGDGSFTELATDAPENRRFREKVRSGRRSRRRGLEECPCSCRQGNMHPKEHEMTSRLTSFSLAAAVAAFALIAACGSTQAGPILVAGASPAPRTTTVGADELYRRGHALEASAQVVQAVPLYREASSRGQAAASQRLMELYADGAPGLGRDYRAAVFYKERAVAQGALLDPPWRH
jgi:TPR repeat protein